MPCPQGGTHHAEVLGLQQGQCASPAGVWVCKTSPKYPVPSGCCLWVSLSQRRRVAHTGEHRCRSPQRRPASPYLARGFDSLKDAQINDSPRKEQAQTQVPADPPRIPNPRASLDVQDIPAREEGELLVPSRGPLTLEMPLLQNNLVNNHRHWQLLAKQIGAAGVISPPCIKEPRRDVWHLESKFPAIPDVGCILV